MTFITNPLGVVSTENSVTLANGTNTAAYNTTSGTVVSATSTSVVLDGTASASDDVYNDLVIQIINGKGAVHSRLITDYVGSTKTATISPSWRILPNTTSRYVIHTHSGACGVQNLENIHTVRLKTTESSVDDFYNQCFFKIVEGEGSGHIHKVVDYDGTTKIATIDGQLEHYVDETSLYNIYGEGGACASSTASTIVLDGNQSAIAGTANLCVEVYSGTGAGQIRKIVSLATNTLSITPDWTVNPVATDKYIIYGGWGGSYETVKDYANLTTVTVIDSIAGEHAAIDMQLGINSTGENKRDKYTEVSSVFPSSVHTLAIVTEYFRFRVIGMGTKINGSTQAIYHTNCTGKPTLFVNEEINENNDCDLNRSILMAKTQNDSYKNINCDVNGNLQTISVGPISAFGEGVVVNLNPVAQIKYTYGMHPDDVNLILSPGTTNIMDVAGDGSTQQVMSYFLPKADSFSTGTSNYFLINAGGGAAFYVWFQLSGSADPTPGGTGILVSINPGETPSQVGSSAQVAIDLNANFGATSVANHIIITNAANGLQPLYALDDMPAISNSSINVTKGEALLTVTLGEGIGDYSIAKSRRSLRYRAGQGSLCRFSAIFDAPIVGVSQYFGVSNTTSALMIGYNGSQFGIIRKTGGLHEIRSLEITAIGGDTTGSVILIIDGITHEIVTTGATTDREVAALISQHNFAGGLYNAEYVDNVVIFVSMGVGSPIGSQTFSFNQNDTTITATFTQLTATQPVTDSIIPQYTWNIDRLDGSGGSCSILQPTFGNVFQIQYQWLGFGAIIFSFEDCCTGRFIPFHNIRYADKNTSLSLSNPCMNMTHLVESTTGTTSRSIKSGSSALFVEGVIKRLDPSYSVGNRHDSISAAVTSGIILSIRNPRVFNELISQVELAVQNITFASSKSNNGTKVTTVLHLTSGGTPSGILDYTYVNEGNSAALYATPAPGDATLSGGSVLYTTAVTSEGTSSINLADVNIILQSNSILYLTYSNPTPSTGDIDLDVEIVWNEDQ